MSTASTQQVSVNVTECRTLMKNWAVPPAVLAVVEKARQQLADGVTATQLAAADGDTLTAAIASIRTVPAPNLPGTVAIIDGAPLAEKITAAVNCYTAAARNSIQSAVVDALRSPQIGFTAVSICTAEQGTAIEARRGDSVVQVVIGSDLRIDRDWMLGPGDACTPLDAELTAQLAAQGIATTSVWTDRHGGRRDGAHLINAARAIEPMAPVRGAVINLARHTQSAGERPASKRHPRPAHATAGS